MRARNLLPGLLALLFVAGCGKPNGGPEITLADLETTNAPVSSSMTRFSPQSGSKITIDGTANMIHTKWRVESTAMGGWLDAGPGFPTRPGYQAKPGKVEAKVEAFIPARSLKSVEDNGKHYSDKMDDIMYEKLKALEQPKITYRLTELVLKEPAKGNDAPSVFESKGELQVAGVTNRITMPVTVLPLGDDKLKVSGAISVKMSDYKIEPPTVNLILGTLKTGDEVKLGFEWILIAKPAPASTPK